MPFGLMSMAMSHVVEDGDWDTVLNLGQFAAVIVGGLLLHSFVILPLVYVVAVRRNPAEVFKKAYPALVTALLMSSSIAARPLTIRFCEESHIDPRIWQPVLPLASRVNRDGTAMYQAVSAVFVAQLRHISLDLSDLVIISVVASVASMKTAAVPEAGSLLTLFVLTATRRPVRDASILVLLELLLDRCNILVNVLGDCFGLSLLQHMSVQELEEESAWQLDPGPDTREEAQFAEC
ncbi:excitatory amino acid transporter 3-like [Menidia menidia]